MVQKVDGPEVILAREEEALLACVHCGFCLSACPTYNRLGDEADSPRGRIHLMRLVVEGTLAPDSAAFQTHIDRCLGCRACEPVCPSGVQYGFLAERARTVAARAGGPNPLGKLLLAAFGSPAASRFVGWNGRLFRAMGVTALQRLLPKGSMRLGLAMLAATRPWSGLKQVSGGKSNGGPPRSPRGTVASAMAADVEVQRERAAAEPHALAGGYPEGTSLTTPAATPVRPRGPRVALLTGCVQEALFGRINRATERVLRAAGCELVAVPEQQCCGALHAHGGELERSQELIRKNIAAYEAANVDFIVVNAAGCGAMMKEYGEQLARDEQWSDRAHALSKKVRDLNEFLLTLDLPRGGSLELRVTYDAPCHLHHAQRITRAPVDVIRQIPGLEYVPLRNAEECCGGAGIYGITHPELGGRIMNDKVDAVLETKADVVVTPNPGCMMQIGAGLLLRGAETRVLHPIELLDESYRRAGLYE